MAKGIINLQKASGGIVKISPADGTGVTELVVPESGELATKEYADLKVALASFTGTNQNFSTSGYQKLPGGLIIQWGIAGNVSPLSLVFPIAFPNRVLQVYTTVYLNDVNPVGSDLVGVVFSSVTNTGMAVRHNNGGPRSMAWFAIGY